MYGQFSKMGSLSGSFLRRVPYYFGDLKGDPNLENYACVQGPEFSPTCGFRARAYEFKVFASRALQIRVRDLRC